VSAGGDVDQIALALGVERIAAREIVQATVNLLEVPRVSRIAPVQIDLGFRRHRRNVLHKLVGQLHVRARVQQLEAVDDQVFVLAHGHARPPFLPASRTGAVVEDGAEKADDHGFHALSDK
jgi:hypothetical protein